jgi:hypothetical protein
MSVGGVHALLQSKLEKLLLRGTYFINVDNWSENVSTKYKHVIGIVNCTEIPINTWQTNAFSKKKGCATLIGTNKSILLFQQYFFYNNNMLKFQ